MPTLLTLERPLFPLPFSRRSSAIIPTILHDERHLDLLTDLSPFLFSYPLLLPVEHPHSTMDIQQAQEALKKFRLGKYALPQGITPGTNPQAEHLYHMTQALRDASGGTPVVQALAQIPTYQQALVQQTIPTEKFAQVNAVLAQLERREMNESQAASALRQLATTPVTSQLGQLSQNLQFPTSSRQEREAQISAAQPRIQAWQDRTAQNSGVSLDKVKSVFKSFSDEQLAAVEASDQTRVIKSGGGGGKTDVVVAMITDAVVNRGARATDFTVLVATHSAEGELVRRLTDIGNTIPAMKLDWAGQVKTFHSKAMSTLNQRVMQASGQAMTPLQAMGMGAYTPFPSSSSSRRAAPKNAEEAFRAQTQEELKYFQNLLTHHGVRVQQSANLFQQIQAVKAEHGYDGSYKDMGIRGAQSWAEGKKDAFESLLYMYEKARMNDPQFKLPSQTGPHYDLADSIILAARAGERGKTQQWKHTVVDEMQDPNQQMYRMLAAQTQKSTGFRFFAGDEGQRTIKSGGSYQAGQAIQQMFPSAKAFPLTGNYRLGPINTAMYSATQMEHVLDNRGRAPFQVSMRQGGTEAFPSMYTATSFKQVNEQMFADYLQRQGLSHTQVAGNITSGAHPLSGASSPGSMPFVFQMKEQRRYFLKTIEHQLSQKVGPAKAKVAMRQMFNQSTPQGQGGSAAHALLVNQTLGKSFPHVFADITRVGSKWSDADYAEQMGVITSRPTEQLHTYSSQTNIAGSNYDLAPDMIHGKPVPPGMGRWYSWFLRNLTDVQGMNPLKLSSEDRQIRQRPPLSRAARVPQDLSTFSRFVEDTIKLLPYSRPAAGAGIGTSAVHSAQSVGITASSDKYGDEGTTVRGITDRGTVQRIMGTAKPEPDMTRINLVVGYARNLLEQGEKLVGEERWKWQGEPGMLKDASHATIMEVFHNDPSKWAYSTGETARSTPSDISDLMKSGMFGYLSGGEKKAANAQITDYMADTTSDDWSPYFNEKSRLMSGDHDRYSYRGGDERTLRQGISDFLGSDLVREHPQIKPLIEGAFTRESVRNVVADPKNAPNTYERQVFTTSPVLKTIQDYAYAQRSDAGQHLLQQVNAASEQGGLDPFIRNLVNNPKDDMLREEILNKAADVISFGYLPPEAIEAIKSAAEEFNYPTLTHLIDAYGDTLYSADYSQVGLRKEDWEYIQKNHPREHALLSALAEKSGMDLSNLKEPAVGKQISMLPYIQGQMIRAAGEKGQHLGIPIAESAFAPFTIQMSALSHNLEKAGILDPMAVQAFGASGPNLLEMTALPMRKLSPRRVPDIGQLAPFIRENSLFGNTISPGEEQALGMSFQSEGVGVGLEGYQKRLEDMLHLHQGGRPRVAYGSATKLDPLTALHTPLSPEQAQGYRTELEQVKSLRKTLSDPSFHLESGHLLNMVHRAATGESAIDKNVKGEHNQPYARFMSPLKNQFGEGNRTLGSIQELVSSLQEGIGHVQGTGTLSRTHTNRILEALGHDPGEFGTLSDLESLASFGEGSSLPLTTLAGQFPSDQSNLLSQFTRFPFKEGQTAAFMGGMPGFTDIAPLGQEKAGLQAGMVGTLHPINKGISFGLPTDYGDFRKHGLYTQDEWKEHGPHAKDPEFLKKIAEPLAMLHTRNRKGEIQKFPVRLSQMSDLYAKGLPKDSQEMLNWSLHRTYSGDVSRELGVRKGQRARVPGWLATKRGQRYQARLAKQNELPIGTTASKHPAPVSRGFTRPSRGAPWITTRDTRMLHPRPNLNVPPAHTPMDEQDRKMYRNQLELRSKLFAPRERRLIGRLYPAIAAQTFGGGASALSPSLRAQGEGANETEKFALVSNTPPQEAFMPKGFVGGSLGAASPFAQGPILGEANQQRIVRNLQNIIPGQLKGLSPQALDEYIRKKQFLLAKSAQDVSQQGRPLDLAAAFLDAFTIQAAQQKSGWVSPLHPALMAYARQITHPFLQQRLSQFPPAKDSPLGQLKEGESYLRVLHKGRRDNYGNTVYGSPDEIQKQEALVASLKQQLAGGGPLPPEVPSAPPAEETFLIHKALSEEMKHKATVSPSPDLAAHLDKQMDFLSSMQEDELISPEDIRKQAAVVENLKSQLGSGGPPPVSDEESLQFVQKFVQGSGESRTRVANIDGEEPAMSLWANEGKTPSSLDPIDKLHQTLLRSPDKQPYAGSIAPDTQTTSSPSLPEPPPADQLEALAKGLREGNSNWGIHPPSDEQKKYMLDPARRTVLEGGPGTGKTATAVRGIMHQVASGAILPKNVLALSAIRSATSRLAGEFGTYRKLLPKGKEYNFPVPRTFASVAASTVLHQENDENNRPYFPILQKLGYKHLTGEVMGDPAAQDLYGKDEEAQIKMMGQGQRAFLTSQINASLTASGKKPWGEQAIKDAQKYIGEVKKGRMSGYGAFDQIARGEKVPQELYTHDIGQGLRDLSTGNMTHPAALALYEQGMRKKGGMDWDDLFSIATEAYQKFGPQALPQVFKQIEAILIDEGQDVNPLMASLQKHFIGALSANNPHVTVAMDVMQSLTQGMGGIPMGEIRGSYRDILGIPEATPFHQLTQNFRSDAGTVAFHNALLKSPHLGGLPHSPAQVARSGNVGKPTKFLLGKTQPEVYQQMFRSRLAATGLPLATIKQNIKSGQHPFTGATLLPKEIATILPRNQDVDLFTHVAKQELQTSLGLGEHEASHVFSQMMRQGMPPASLQEHTPEWEQAQMQMPLLKFMGSRGNEYQDVAMDASLVGAWQRNEDIPGHLRNLFVGGTRTSAGGQTTIGAAQLPFNYAEAERYMNGGGINLSRMAYGKRGSANTFEEFQGQQVPRFFRDLSQGAHKELQQWGMNPDAGRKVVDSTLTVNAKDVKMNIPSGGSVSIQGTNVQAPGGINIVKSSTPPPPGSKWAGATPPGTNSPVPAAAGSSFNPFTPPRRGGPLGGYAGGGMGGRPSPGSSGSNAININATGGGPPPPDDDNGGKGGGWNNAASQFGRSMARLGYELQFMGKYLGDIVTQALQQGSEYRMATGGLPGSGSTGTKGFYDFSSSTGITAYQQKTLPMYSTTQIAQGVNSLYATTGYRGATPPLGAATDMMGLAAITGIDPTELMGNMAYLSGSSGQGKNMGSYGNMTGMLGNLFGNVLTGANVTPTLSALSSIVPTLNGIAPGSGSQTGQAMAFFQLAQNAGMTPQNFGDVSSLMGSLTGIGTAPNLQQQYTLQKLGYPMTADTQLTQYQQEQTSRDMQIASLGLQQNINEGVAGINGGQSTGSPLSLPQLQIQVDQAQITMDKANLTMSGIQLQAAQVGQQGAELQYQYGQASYNFNLAMQNALYGPIGKDSSQLAGYSFQQNQLMAQRNSTSPEVGTMFTPQNVSGLRNQEFYAGLQNQQQSLILGRSPLLSDALFQQQMKYIAQQADYYKQELALRNQQREFDMVWQKRLLDQQGAQVAAQGRIVAYQGYIYSLQQSQFHLEVEKNLYDQKQAAIAQQFLARQAGDLEAINASMNQFLNGQGPVGGQNLQPQDLVQRMADELKSGKLNPSTLQSTIRGLGLSPQDQSTMYQLVIQLSKSHETLGQMTKNMNNAGDKQVVDLFNKLKKDGAFNINVQQAGQQNASLQQGGVGANWDQLTANTANIATAETTIAKVLAPGTPFLQDISTIANLLGPIAVGIGTLANIIGLLLRFRPVGTGGGGVGGGAAGGAGLLGPLVAAGLEVFGGWSSFDPKKPAAIPWLQALGGPGFLGGYGLHQGWNALQDPKGQATAFRQMAGGVGDWLKKDPLDLSKITDDVEKFLGIGSGSKKGQGLLPSLWNGVKNDVELFLGIGGNTHKQGLLPFSINSVMDDIEKFLGVGSGSKKGQGIIPFVLNNMVDDVELFLGVGSGSKKGEGIIPFVLNNMVDDTERFLGIGSGSKKGEGIIPYVLNNLVDDTEAYLGLGSAAKKGQGLIPDLFNGLINDIKNWLGLNAKTGSGGFLGDLFRNIFGNGNGNNTGGGEGSIPGPSGAPPGFDTPHVNTQFGQKMWYGTHQGIDFAADQGTPLAAFNSGKVTNTGFFPWGGEVDVDMGGGFTERYLHLSAIAASKGQVVRPGQLLGLTGGGTPQSGFGYWSRGPHSHVQVDRGNMNSGINPWPIWALTGATDIKRFYGISTMDAGAGAHGGAGGARQLAEGGIAMKRVIAEIGEGKEPEAVLPLSRLSNLLKAASSTQTPGHVTQPTKAIQVSKLADKFEIHVHTTASKLDDQAIDDLGAQFFDILTTELQKL